MEKLAMNFDVVMTHYNGQKPVIVEAIAELLQAQFQLQKVETEMIESPEKASAVWKCNMAIDGWLHILKNATNQSAKFAYMLKEAINEPENAQRPTPTWYKPSL